VVRHAESRDDADWIKHHMTTETDIERTSENVHPVKVGQKYYSRWCYQGEYFWPTL